MTEPDRSASTLPAPGAGPLAPLGPSAAPLPASPGLPAPPPHDGAAPRVLIVDDVAENLKVVGSMLDGRGIDLCFATSGPQALASAHAAPPDLVLLDVAMPEMDGYEVARRFKASEGLRSIPIIFITARTRTEDLVEGFRSGGVDYVTKPFVSAELIARVTAHLELKRAQDVIAGQIGVLR
ncbi:MAG TPA: response regulator, partial [Spirochaetia bacterium]|nr:response regulator [Spirochaetia bacterium]